MLLALEVIGTVVLLASLGLIVVLARLGRRNPEHPLYRSLGTTNGAIVPLVGIATGAGLLAY